MIVTTWVVYSLSDPRTGKVRYVGWTSRGVYRRLTCHLSEARVGTGRGCRTYKARWIKSLLDTGMRPIIGILESGTGGDWPEAEQRWIRLFRQFGEDLVNASDGGEGNIGYVASPEARAKISQAKKGKNKLTPEHLAKWVEASRKANTGRVFPREVVERRAAKLRGLPRPPEVMAKCRAALVGVPKSVETREKIAAARRGSKASPETRAKMRASAKRRPPRSAETRARLSAALKGRLLGNREAQAASLRGKVGPRLGAVLSIESRAKISQSLRRTAAKKREAAKAGLLCLWERPQ